MQNLSENLTHIIHTCDIFFKYYINFDPNKKHYYKNLLFYYSQRTFLFFSSTSRYSFVTPNIHNYCYYFLIRTDSNAK